MAKHKNHSRSDETHENIREREPRDTAMQRTGGQERGLSSPFSFMRRFSEDMDRLFEDFGLGRGWLSSSLGELSASGLRELGRAAWSPQVEVFRRAEHLVVRCDLPGLRKEDVHVAIQDGQLVLQGERVWENEADPEGVMRSERRYGSFHRVIPLPEGARVEEARASYKDGVLEITLPAPAERPRGHRVPID